MNRFLFWILRTAGNVWMRYQIRRHGIKFAHDWVQQLAERQARIQGFTDAIDVKLRKAIVEKGL